MDAAVGIYDIVIADVVPTKAFMVAADALYCAVCIGAGGGAMEDDFGDSSHFFDGFDGADGVNGRLWAATVSQHTQQ